MTPALLAPLAGCSFGSVSGGDEPPLGVQKHAPTLTGTELLGRPTDISVIALGEIRSGILRGRRAAKNQTRLKWFLSQDGVFTMGIDAPVSHRYAELHHALRRLGQPIPANDLWIAAMAIEHALVLYTRDTHFAHVPRLACV